MKISKDLKKLLVCGASLVMVASLGSGISNVSAKRIHHYHNRTARVYRHHNKRTKQNKNSKQSRHARYMAQRKAQYKGLQHYLTWLNWYDGHHAQKMNTWKARHLYYFMNRLSGGQKRQLMNRLARINISAPKYYRTHFAKKNLKRNKRAKHMKRNKSIKKNRRASHRVFRKHNKRVRKNQRKLPKVTKVIVQTPNQHKGTNVNTNSSNQSKWDNNLTAEENEKIDNDVKGLPEPTRDTVRKQLQFSTEKAIKFNAMPKWENVTNQKQYNQDAKIAEAETKAHPSAVRDMWNMPDTYEYAHVAPVKAWIAYDPMYYSHVIKLLYPDGEVVVYPSGLDGRYPSNSLRNYYGYEKFAKKHPREAYNWLLHPITNYNEFDDGEESSVGHDYTPVGPGIPYHD